MSNGFGNGFGLMIESLVAILLLLRIHHRFGRDLQRLNLEEKT